MAHHPVSDFARKRRHAGADRPEMDRDPRVFDGTGVEEGLHAGELVVLAFEVQRSPFLPAGKNGAQRLDVLAHPRHGCRPWRAVAPHDVSAHLGPQAEFETTVGKLLEVPRRVGHRHRAPGKGHQDAGGHVQARRRFERNRRGGETVVDGFGNIETVVAQGLGPPSVRGHGRKRHPLVHRRKDSEHLAVSSALPRLAAR